MKTNVIRVRQGDSTPQIEISPFIENYVGAELLTDPGWVCRCVVRPTLAKAEVLAKAIGDATADILAYVPILEPAETQILSAKPYDWIIEIENLTRNPTYRREHHFRLVVERRGLPNPAYTYTDYTITSIGTAANAFADTYVIVIPNAVIGTVQYIDVLNAAGEWMQTVGWDSEVINGSDLEITVTENIVGSPVTMRVAT